MIRSGKTRTNAMNSRVFLEPDAGEMLALNHPARRPGLPRRLTTRERHTRIIWQAKTRARGERASQPAQALAVGMTILSNC